MRNLLVPGIIGKSQPPNLPEQIAEQYVCILKTAIVDCINPWALSAHIDMPWCSNVQAHVLSDMFSLTDHMLADWRSGSSTSQQPDEHYQALLLRAVSIILLNPWVDDDQTGRRCNCCALSQLHACHADFLSIPTGWAATVWMPHVAVHYFCML